MATSLEVVLASVCVVCNQETGETPASIYSSLTARTGSIHSHMSQVVGCQELQLACQASQVLCSMCLNTLRTIVNLECQVLSLKNVFRGMFQKGIESRKNEMEENVAVGDPLKSSVVSETETAGPVTVVCDDYEWIQDIAIPHASEAESVRKFTNVSQKISVSKDCTKTNLSSDQIISVKEPSIGFEGTNSDNSVGSAHGNEKPDDTSITSDGDIAELATLHCFQESDEGRNFPSHDDDDPINALRSYSTSGDTNTHSSERMSTFKNETHFTSPLTNRTELNKPQSQLGDTSAFGSIDEGTTVNHKDEFISGDLDNQFSSDSDAFGSADIGDVNVVNTSRRTRAKQQSCSRGAKLQKRKKNKLKVREKTHRAKDSDYEENSIWQESDNTQVTDSRAICEVCGESFDSRNQLDKHRGYAHAAVYCYVCDRCPNVRYREKAKLTQHVSRMHKASLHQCPGCDYEAPSQNVLDQHLINQHPSSRYFECHICHKAFRTYRYLKFVHIKRCHFGLPIKYRCEKCQKGFVDKSSFENHKITHSEHKNFSCDYCGSKFHTSYALKVHVNTHTQEKKYVCADCGSAFLRHCNLTAHKKRLHSSEDLRLVCELCGKSVATRKDLRRHQLAYHSKGKPFSCVMCSRTYTARTSLETHMRTHTGVKPFECKCGRAFYRNTVLRRHQRTVHFGDEFEQDITRGKGARKIGPISEEKTPDDNMVVITLKECNPPSVYTVEEAPLDQQEIMVSHEPPTTHPQNSNSSNSLVTETLPSTRDASLPLLHSQIETLASDKLGLAAPVLFTTLTTTTTSTITNPTSVQHGQDTHMERLSPGGFVTNTTAVAADGLQAGDPLSLQHAPPLVISHTKEQGPSAPVLGDSIIPATCTSLTTQLIQLPSLHSSSMSSSPVTLVAAWPQLT